jgi:large subunit ribosomal protein L22
VATAVKTNERPGTRAQAKFVRVTPSKARAVLDLVRGKPVDRALEILEFSERGVSAQVMRTLESAVANAEHNDQIPAEELYVSACYADEGPTLKRWRPRARGRATRIQKKTCHITVIVSRLSPQELEARREREESRGGRASRTASDARRRRVEKSRQEKAERKAERDAAEEHDHDHDDEAVTETATDEAPSDETAESAAAEDADDTQDTDESAADEAEDTDEAEAPPSEDDENDAADEAEAAPEDDEAEASEEKD